jgi:hypothetical protein
MVKQSRKQRMKALSWLLSLAVVSLVAVGVVQIRHDDLLTGTELVGWAFVPLALLLGFTWVTRCRVETSRHTACRNDAYGFLFGCQGNGHWMEKFRIRIGMRRGESKPIQPRRTAAAQTFMHQPVPPSQPPKVIVEDNVRNKLGFWIAVISMIAGVVQAVAAFAFH